MGVRNWISQADRSRPSYNIACKKCLSPRTGISTCPASVPASSSPQLAHPFDNLPSIRHGSILENSHMWVNSTFCKGCISSSVGVLAIAMGLAGILATTGCGWAGDPANGGAKASTVVSASSGTSQANTPPAVLTASSTNVNFGNVTVGTSTAQLITLTDSGSGNVSISIVSTVGPGFSASGDRA